MNKIIHYTVGIVCELLTIRDPYAPKYQRPKLIAQKTNACGHVVRQIIRASNHTDATRHLRGVTGLGQIIATRVGPKTWRIDIE